MVDGRVFLSTSPAGQAWDIISIDSYTTNRYGATIPAHLVTREFFTQAKQHLNPGGVLHFHCFAGPGVPIARAIDRTLSQVFPNVVKFSGHGFTEFFASASPLSKDDMMQRAKPLPWIDLRAAASELTGSKLWPAADPILTDDYAPIDTLLRRH